MKKYRNDIILILLIIVVSVVSLLAFNLTSSKDNMKVSIYSSDELVYEIYLDEVDSDIVLDIEGKISTMKVLITSEGVEVLDSDCHDRICINQGLIDKSSQTISCLPNEVYITITSSEGMDGII
jgi:hypothetical protein